MGYNQGRVTAASDIYHNHLEEVHQVCEDFQRKNHFDSLNKMMHLIGHLHSVGGAHYQYNSDTDYPEVWLRSNGKAVLTELISDANEAKLDTAAKSLKIIKTELEENKLV